MKKLCYVILILFLICLIFARQEVYNEFHFQQKNHLFNVESKQPYVLMSHKDLIVKINANNEREIIYENPQRLAEIENNRNTLLRLHFNQDYPGFVILNENNVFTDSDATWINETTAEISVPEGIYKICTIFYFDSLWKLVINSNVDLTSGGVVEIFIDHNEAIYLLEHNSTDINNEPFDLSDKFYANFCFHFLERPFFLGFIDMTNDMMFTSGFSEDIVFVTGELIHNDNSIYITQYGPFPEIDSSLSFSNEPADYHQQQLSLDIPSIIEDPKIGISNTYWSDTGEGFFFYLGIMAENYLLDCNDDQWNTDLYMMNNVYTATGNTTTINIGSLEDDFFMPNYFTSPFHCIEGSIGSFLNFVPTIVDYLSPNGEQLFFGQSPIYIKAFHMYNDNLFSPIISIYGYNNELRWYDVYNSTFTLTDSDGNLFAEGELLDLWNFNLPPDQYTLIVEDTNFSLKGLSGTGKLTNIFDSTLEMPNPPYFNALQIRNEYGKPVNQIEHNESSSLLISVADNDLVDNVYVYSPVITDSVKAFYKNHFEDMWNELDIEFIHDYNNSFTWTYGKVFSADLSSLTAIDSVAYDLKISSKDEEDNYTEFILEPAFVVGNFDATSIIYNEIPISTFTLTNYPNPFKPSGAGCSPATTISFNISRKDAKNAKVEIYNIKGQRVKTLECINRVDTKATESLSHYSVTWNGRDDNNKPVTSGVYFYQLVTDNKIINKKMLLLK